MNLRVCFHWNQLSHQPLRKVPPLELLRRILRGRPVWPNVLTKEKRVARKPATGLKRCSGWKHFVVIVEKEWTFTRIVFRGIHKTE